MEPQWQEIDGITSDFLYRDIFEQIKQVAHELSPYRNCSDNSLQTKNIVYDKPKEGPFIIIYKSKPIRGITLELWGKNPKYNW